MVVEFLTFDLEPAEVEYWLEVEEQHWSRFLERQPGFVKKEIWRRPDEPRVVHAVIWWQSMDHWKSIPEAELEAVSQAMGEWEREPTCATFELTRNA